MPYASWIPYKGKLTNVNGLKFRHLGKGWFKIISE